MDLRWFDYCSSTVNNHLMISQWKFQFILLEAITIHVRPQTTVH